MLRASAVRRARFRHCTHTGAPPCPLGCRYPGRCHVWTYRESSLSSALYRERLPEIMYRPARDRCPTRCPCRLHVTRLTCFWTPASTKSAICCAWYSCTHDSKLHALKALHWLSSLSACLTDSCQVGNQLVYRYDYGNDWYHLLTLMQVAEPSQVCPRLIRLTIPTPSPLLPVSPNEVIC